MRQSGKWSRFMIENIVHYSSEEFNCKWNGIILIKINTWKDLYKYVEIKEALILDFINT